MSKRHQTFLGQDVQQIDPSSMTFLFLMGKDECHRERTGTCSFEKRFGPGKNPYPAESDLGYCHKVYSQIDQFGFFYPVDIIKCGCGHYCFNDGQHRTCIAKKKGLIVPAIVSIIDDGCEFCAPRRNVKKGDLR